MDTAHFLAGKASLTYVPHTCNTSLKHPRHTGLLLVWPSEVRWLYCARHLRCSQLHMRASSYTRPTQCQSTHYTHEKKEKKTCTATEQRLETRHLKKCYIKSKEKNARNIITPEPRAHVSSSITYEWVYIVFFSKVCSQHYRHKKSPLCFCFVTDILARWALSQPRANAAEVSQRRKIKRKKKKEKRKGYYCAAPNSLKKRKCTKQWYC